MSERRFFVGYLPPANVLPGLYLAVIAAVITLFRAAGFLLGGAQDAPEPSGFRFDLGRQGQPVGASGTGIASIARARSSIPAA